MRSGAGCRRRCGPASDNAGVAVERGVAGEREVVGVDPTGRQNTPASAGRRREPQCREPGDEAAERSVRGQSDDRHG